MRRTRFILLITLFVLSGASLNRNPKDLGAYFATDRQSSSSGEPVNMSSLKSWENTISSLAAGCYV